MTEIGGQATPDPLTDDTPRDPLAALHGMDPFEAYRTGWAAAMALVREQDATRPSGDEALRAAFLAGVRRGASDGMESYPMVADDYLAALATPPSAPDAHAEMDGHCRQWFEGYGAAVAASSAPDVEGLLEKYGEHLDTCEVPRNVWQGACTCGFEEALAALRDSRS